MKVPVQPARPSSRPAPAFSVVFIPELGDEQPRQREVRVLGVLLPPTPPSPAPFW